MQNMNTWKLNRNWQCAPPLPFMRGFKLSPAWATNPSAVCAAAYSLCSREGLWNGVWEPGWSLWQPRWGNCQPRESHKVIQTVGSLTFSLLAPGQLCRCPIHGGAQGWGENQSTAGDWSSVTFKVPFNLSHSMNSLKELPVLPPVGLAMPTIQGRDLLQPGEVTAALNENMLWKRGTGFTEPLWSSFIRY